MELRKRIPWNCLRVPMVLSILAWLFTSVVFPVGVSAGGGPETVLIVVNARSLLSQRVANEYVQLREIPREHVVLLDEVPSMKAVSIELFREKIWKPIRDFIRTHHLEEEIDTIAYSADFPYAVNFSSDVKSQKLPKNKMRGSVASLTALTYFARRVESRDIGYLGRNHYFREFAGPSKKRDPEAMASDYGPFELSHGFRNNYVWSNSDLAFWETGDGLDQYYLSTMLAYTGERGNSLPEILNYLETAASSDGTHPSGTVYLLENSNIRSETRQPLFPPTVKELAKRGRKGEILSRGKDGQNGVIPIGRNDVIGAVVGSRSYRWGKADSRLLPGAIAESFTSYGGDFNRGSQTKLSEFLRYGAAGSSGAVAEPYAFQEKFPLPLLHVYYADGCSLAESFYQSVLVPYQLIIVGDPLTRPYAEFAQVKLKAPVSTQPWSGRVSIEADVRPASGRAVRKVELWVDGQYLSDAPVDEAIVWDTRTVEDGNHEIRLLAIEDSTIETRSFARFPVQVLNTDLTLSVNKVKQAVSYGEDIQITGKTAGVELVELYQGYRLLDSVSPGEGEWRFQLPSSSLGLGPNSLFVKASSKAGTRVRSGPIEFVVGEPRRLQPVMQERPSGEGLNMTVYDREGKESHLTIRKLNGRFKELKKSTLEVSRVKLEGFLQITESGFFQIAVKANGRFRFLLDDKVFVDTTLSHKQGEVLIPLGLDAGWHKLQIDMGVSGKLWLKAVLAGEQAPVILSQKNLAHHPTLPTGDD